MKRMLSVGRRFRHDPGLPPWLREAPRPTHTRLPIPRPHTISYDDLIGVICVAFALGFALGYLLGFHGNG